MSLKRIEVKNFKSFKELKINLGKFNTLIGANASGKSNFIQIFKFLMDIANFGLENAISMQGGVKYLRNINIGTSKNFSLKVVFDQKAEFTKQTKKGFSLISRPTDKEEVKIFLQNKIGIEDLYVQNLLKV